MLFNFLKKIFGWADEGSKKRKATETSCLGNEFVAPKRLKTDCNTTHFVEDYFDIDDSDNEDIIFLSKQKFSPSGSCTKLNGTHKPQPYQAYPTVASPICKSPCSPEHCNTLAMGYFTNQRREMQDSCKDLTLCKTNQLKERHQYEELLQNFFPSGIFMTKDKRPESISSRNAVEVIELDKSGISTSIKSRQPTENAFCWRRSMLNNTRIDKGKVPTLDHNKKDTATYSQSNKAKIERTNASTTKPISTVQIKPVAANSLRDELAAKAVMRQDFIPQVAKRYNERIERRYREAEELKKMTFVLSKHNRYAREAALEEQLARSMRLCMAVLDEREESEELLLPTLTDEMLQEVRNALILRPPDEILAEGFGLRITRKDLHTLADLNWLNDEVINFYMNLLIARGTDDKYPRVHAMNTFFYPKLLSGGHSSLKRWTRKVDIFAQEIVVVPIHLGIHWCMSIIDFREKSILYYDSMGSNNPKCLAALKQYLQEESLDKKKQTYDTSEWKLQSAKNIPQQMNGSDCGVFSCMFAEYICANKKITFTQQDMPYFRNKMVYEILRGKLL